MTEGEINLGSDRLAISKVLGDEFVKSLERQSSKLPLATSVRERLLENSTLRILGIRLDENSQFEDTENTLAQQMGLPSGSNLGTVKDRLAGRENDFLLVVSGMGSLSQEDKKRFEKKLSKLGIESITD